MKYKFLIALFFMLTVGFTAGAQEPKLNLNLNYNYSFPLSHFNSDLVSDASPRGFTGNLMYEINPKLSLGLGIGYQDYYQKYDRKVYNSGKTQQISAVLSNSIQMVPVMARLEYLPMGGTMTKIQPYISLAAGANFINYDQYLGQFASGQASTGFRGSAGVGVKIPFGNANGWGIDIGGSYDYAPYKKFGYTDLNTANVHGGVYFSLK